MKLGVRTYITVLCFVLVGPQIVTWEHAYSRTRGSASGHLETDERKRSTHMQDLVPIECPSSRDETETLTLIATRPVRVVDDTSQNQNATGDGRDKEIWISLTGGIHSENINEGSSGFERGVTIDLSMAVPLSARVNFEVIVTFWNAKNKPRTGPSFQEPSGTIDGKNLSLAIGFVIVQSQAISISVEPTVGIGGGNTSIGAMLVAGVSGEINLPIRDDWARFTTRVGYESGTEINVGGGFRYAFGFVRLGFGFDIGKLTGD